MSTGVPGRTAVQLSPEAQACAGWFRQLARTLKVCRLYRSDNPVVTQSREAVTVALQALLREHKGWDLRFSASAIFIGDEAAIRTGERAQGDQTAASSVVDQLPFLFYRDGIRRLEFMESVPRSELDALIDGLIRATQGPDTQDDLVTLLWQANLHGIHLEAVPLEQTIYLSTRAGGGGPEEEKRGQGYAVAPTGSEIRADLGQLAGAQGLHRDTFDDWALPLESADVPAAWAALEGVGMAASARFLADWERENAAPWTAQAPILIASLLRLDGGPDMRAALARSVVTWLTAALQRVALDEVEAALDQLNALDPDRSMCAEDLASALDGLDTDALTEHLDESEADPARLPALVVAIGPPALGFVCAVMAKATKARTRAAACTALCFLTNDNPELLAPWLADSRWHVVRNIVFVLGHIGGSEVVPLLRGVARHPELRVRRQLVQALGAVSPEERLPILVGQLDTRDPQLLAAALNMLTREKDARVAKAILECIEAPDFESRNENNQRALFNALGEVAGDETVPALETLMHKGGWFARRTLERMAAARTLRRIGTDQAMAVLEAGLRARSEAVRVACIEALGTRSRA